MDQPVNPGADAASSSNVVDYAEFASRRQAKLVASGHVVAEPDPAAPDKETAPRSGLIVVASIVQDEAAETTSPGDDPVRA